RRSLIYARHSLASFLVPAAGKASLSAQQSGRAARTAGRQSRSYSWPAEPLVQLGGRAAPTAGQLGGRARSYGTMRSTLVNSLGHLMNNVEINRILETMLGYKENISDLNFSVGRAPQVEVSGSLVGVPIKGMEKLSPYQL